MSALDRTDTTPSLGEHAGRIADEIGDAAEEAAAHFEWVGRAGWIAKGIVYTLVGALFVQIGIGGGHRGEANQAGAIETIADTPGGSVLLVGVGIGLALYTAWRILTVILPGDWTGRALLDRIGYSVSAAIYLSLLFTIVEFLRTSRSDAENREDRLIETAVKHGLAMPAGRTLVIIAGVVVAGIGVAFAHKGYSGSFHSQISGEHGIEGTMIDRLGRIGWMARGLSMGIIGFFLARAAWLFDSNEAAGFDDSIRQLTGTTIGALLAVLVGVGFIAYGIFAALSARHRDLKGPRND